MNLYIQTCEFIKGGMYLRIKSAEKRRDIMGRGRGMQTDMLRINPQKKDGTSGENRRKDVLGNVKLGNVMPGM